MILKEGEYILCRNHDDFVLLAERLTADGYEMFNSQFGPVEVEAIGSLFDAGVRWMPGFRYPRCVAFVGKNMAREVIEQGFITCNGEENRFSVKWYESFDGGKVDVEDLL